MNTVYNAHNPHIWPHNSQHQLCLEIKYASYARSLYGMPHLINLLVFVHRRKYLLFFLLEIVLKILKYCDIEYIEISMWCQINLYPLDMFMSPRLTSVHSRYHEKSVTSVRAAAHHWTRLSIGFHIFENNLRCFVLKSDTCQNLSF